MDIDLHDKTQLYRIVAGVFGVAAILAGCLVVLAPFFPAILLATILALSAWPAFAWLERRLQGRTAVAALLATLILVAGFIVPLVVIGSSVADNVNTLYQTILRSMEGDATGRIAGLLSKIPHVGEDLGAWWGHLVLDRARISALLATHGGRVSQILLAVGVSIGQGVVDLSLGVLIAYFFFRHGARVAEHARVLIQNFGGERGERLLSVSHKTLIGVVYGMTGTALLQGAVGAMGFSLSGIPAASLLGLLTFFASFVPGGPALVWVPAVLWLFNGGETGWAIFLALWGALVVGSIDNFVRPWFVSRGVNLPFILVFLGLVGGVFSFGFIGLFIGPTILALAWALVLEWSAHKENPQPERTDGQDSAQKDAPA